MNHGITSIAEELEAGEKEEDEERDGSHFILHSRIKYGYLHLVMRRIQNFVNFSV